MLGDVLRYRTPSTRFDLLLRGKPLEANHNPNPNPNPNPDPNPTPTPTPNPNQASRWRGSWRSLLATGCLGSRAQAR
eukprot:scaffold4483_cov39-Phaeocystis_antarctica.AAC.2